jgi:hypothetical protein
MIVPEPAGEEIIHGRTDTYDYLHKREPVIT